ncbi:hypothetical protein OE88DRAFT_1643424 [Heliocybe sulcata]|uniref:Uncharacterized protein n=1 Tax=Heliocybe sulcata TaxID=5364 RepID=A0A5C3NBD1_9AGAM|nr:hypothetical protein OE88DRAFT_1643424 [Heliocybe sulcata]
MSRLDSLVYPRLVTSPYGRTRLSDGSSMLITRGGGSGTWEGQVRRVWRNCHRDWKHSKHLMAPTKRRKDDEKENFFVNTLSAPPKRRRRALQLTTEQLQLEQQRHIEEREARGALERKDREREEEEQQILAAQAEQDLANARLANLLRGIQADGFTLNTFLTALPISRYQHRPRASLSRMATNS